MAEAPNSGNRLPDEAFVSHARRPNPSVDEHVAFPDEATRPGARADALPQSAWAGSSRRPKEPVAPELAHIPPEVATLIPGIAARQRQRRVSRSRFNPAGLGLAVIVALALLLGTNASVQLGPSGPVVERGWDERSGWSESWDELDLVATPAVVDTILPVDQPRYEIPLGPSRLRIEIVSDDPSADVVVTSDSGEAQLDDVALPYGADLTVDERPDQFAVTAWNRYGDRSIQCRVYADDQLVSIATGDGLVECRAEPSR